MSEPMNPAMLETRLVRFAVRVLRLSSQLGPTPAGRHVAGQILRSGTAAAPHYAEAQSAESRMDFIHKLRLAVKELNETSVWLRIIAEAEMLKPTLMDGIVTECEELRRILGAAIHTARERTIARPVRHKP